MQLYKQNLYPFCPPTQLVYSYITNEFLIGLHNLVNHNRNLNSNREINFICSIGSKRLDCRDAKMPVSTQRDDNFEVSTNYKKHNNSI